MFWQVSLTHPTTVHQGLNPVQLQSKCEMEASWITKLASLAKRCITNLRSLRAKIGTWFLPALLLRAPYTVKRWVGLSLFFVFELFLFVCYNPCCSKSVRRQLNQSLWSADRIRVGIWASFKSGSVLSTCCSCMSADEVRTPACDFPQQRTLCVSI